MAAAIMLANLVAVPVAQAQSGYQTINGTEVYTEVFEDEGYARFSNSCGSQTLTQGQLQGGAIPDRIIPCPRSQGSTPRPDSAQPSRAPQPTRPRENFKAQFDCDYARDALKRELSSPSPCSASSAATCQRLLKDLRMSCPAAGRPATLAWGQREIATAMQTARQRAREADSKQQATQCSAAISAVKPIMPPASADNARRTDFVEFLKNSVATQCRGLADELTEIAGLIVALGGAQEAFAADATAGPCGTIIDKIREGGQNCLKVENKCTYPLKVFYTEIGGRDLKPLSFPVSHTAKTCVAPGRDIRYIRAEKGP